MILSLRQFLVIIVIGMTLLLMALLYFHTRLNQEYLQYHLDTHNRNLAIVLRNFLLGDGLESIMVGDGKSLSEATRSEISTRLERQLRWVPVVKVKIYDNHAMVLFSTKATEIGNNSSDNQGVQSALNGLASSGRVHPNHLNEFDNVIELQDIHQQYIPIRNLHTAEVIGAFEIYTDITDIVENLDSKQETMFWWISGILVAFYLALAASFLSIARLMRKGSLQRQIYLDELKAIHEDLEKRVADRTAQLDQSKQFLQSVIDGIGNPLLVIKSDFTIALMNNAAKKLIPKGQDAKNYRYCYQVSHRRDTPCTGPDHPCAFMQVMEQGSAVRVRHTHHDADNQPVIIDLLTTPLYSSDGKFEGVIEVEHDVTEIVRIQAGLIESEMRLQTIMDNVPEAILTCDSDSIIQSINPSALRLLEDTAPELTGKKFDRFLVDDSVMKELKHETGLQKETVLKRADGSEFPADLWIGPLEYAGQTTGYVVVIRDISGRLQAQQELETARLQYFHQEKMAAIGQLAAGIIHEVGNPIAAIAGAASELKTMAVCAPQSVDRYAFDDAISRNIDLIDEQTTRLAKITREIADFASPRPQERELIDVNGLLKSTTQVLAYDQRFRTIQLELDLDKNLPAIVGVADQLTQVFMNLLINAMDACISSSTEKKRIFLKSSQVYDEVEIVIQDNGCGMSSEVLGHIMEPFYTTKPVGKGSGLGLSLCETIVGAHGGNLDIETEENRGTTIHIFLPIVQNELSLN